MSRAGLLLLAALAASVAAACGGGSSSDAPACLAVPTSTAGEAAPEGVTSFVAFQQNFAGYHAWKSVAATTSRATDAFHGTVAFTAYLNRAPAHGTGEFPIGTIIVKETSDGARDQRSTFAMVKRGGGFNPSGGGWEWFELQQTCSTDEPLIQWRGIGPPAGEKYGGDPNGCNTCHSTAADNDFVWSDALQLQNF